MIESGIEMDIFPLILSKQQFNYSLFWGKVLKNNEISSESLENINPESKLEELNIKLRRKHFRKKTFACLPFKLTSELSIGVKLFSIFRKLKKKTPINFHKETGKPLVRISRYKSKDTGNLLYEDEIGKYFPLGDEKVSFESDELKKIREIVPLEFVLIGFRPSTVLKSYYSIQPSLLVLADEDESINSSRVVHALVTKMKASNLIAVCRARLKENSGIRFCMLLPQEEGKDNYGGVQPCGFHAIILPYGDELRNLQTYEPTPINNPTNSELNVSESLINQLTVEEFDPLSFENTELQRFYSVIQAMALNQELPKVFEDYLQPDIEAIQDKIEVFTAFNQEFFLNDTTNELQNDAKSLFTTSTQINKIEYLPEEQLKKLRLNELLDIAQKINLKPSQKIKKNDLITLIIKNR